MVLLPLAERPVNLSVQPVALSDLNRSARERFPSCQVMLVARIAE